MSMCKTLAKQSTGLYLILQILIKIYALPFEDGSSSNFSIEIHFSLHGARKHVPKINI